MPRTENNNWQLGSGMLASAVDQLAQEIADEFKNEDFKPWYCGAVYDLGVSRIHELRKKVEGAKNPAKLFSFYVNQERKALKRNAEFKSLRDGIGS